MTSGSLKFLELSEECGCLCTQNIMTKVDYIPSLQAKYLKLRSHVTFVCLFIMSYIYIFIVKKAIELQILCYTATDNKYQSLVNIAQSILVIKAKYFEIRKSIM